MSRMQHMVSCRFRTACRRDWNVGEDAIVIVEPFNSTVTSGCFLAGIPPPTQLAIEGWCGYADPVGNADPTARIRPPIKVDIGVEPVAEAAQTQDFDAGAQHLHVASGFGQGRRRRRGAQPVAHLGSRSGGDARICFEDRIAMGCLHPKRCGGDDLAWTGDMKGQEAAVAQRTAQRDAAFAEEEEMRDWIAAMEECRSGRKYALGRFGEDG